MIEPVVRWLGSVDTVLGLFEANSILFWCI
jgi:hypothetical protein